MLKSCIRNLLSAAMVAMVMCALALPAQAARWVRASDSDPWFWLDLDSRTMRDGVTYYIETHTAQSGVSPDVAGTYGGTAPELNRGINCTTGQIYSNEITNYDEWMAAVETDDYSVDPIYAWIDTTADTSAERRAATKRIVCAQ